MNKSIQSKRAIHILLESEGATILWKNGTKTDVDKTTYPEIALIMNLSRETIYQIRQTPTYKAESLNIDKGDEMRK